VQGWLWRAAPASLSDRRSRRRGKGGAGPGGLELARGVVGLEANRRKRKGGGKEGGEKKTEKRKRKGEKRNKEIGKKGK
jgi:hypothetical protein